MAAGVAKSHKDYCVELRSVHGRRVRAIEDYVNDGTKIRHACSKGHTYLVRPNHALRGVGCPRCAEKERGLTRRGKRKDEYAAQVERIHKGRIKPLAPYLYAQTPLLHKCNVCAHKWMATPDNVVNTTKTGCPACVRHRTHSSKAIAWIRQEARKRGIRIRHAENWGEFKIPGTRYSVDGYHKPTNTVFEFYGDVYHGNPKVFGPRQKCHPFNKAITAGRLYRDTLAREAELKALGYKVVSIWELDYERKNRKG